MKPKLIVFILLPFTFVLSAFAGSATWNINPTNGDWNTATNWMPNTVPNSPTDIATFDVSNVTAVSLSADTTVDGVVFNPGASAFSITVPVRRTFTFAGQGVTNNSGVVQNFATAVNGDKIGTIVFINEASAGDDTIFTAGADLAAGEDSFIKFFGNSSGGNSTFLIEGGGTTANDIYGSTLVFDENSTATDAVIVAKAGAGEVDFFGSSTAGNASIVLEGPSSTTFYGGFGHFEGSSSADDCTIQLGGTAGYPVNADFGGFLVFDEGSNVGSALITIEGATGDGGAGGTVSFSGHGVTLANATIIANGTDFQDATGGKINFLGTEDDGDATIIVNGGEAAGGQCIFGAGIVEGRARIEVFGNGLITVFPTVQVGSIEGDGMITIGSFAQALLQIGSNNLSTTFSGLIQDGVQPGPIEKNGTGTLTLSGANTYTGGTTVTSGVLLVSNASGSGTGSGAVTVNGGTLGGGGIISGPVTIDPGASLAPAAGTNKQGSLTLQNSLTLQAGATYTYTFKANKNKARTDLVIASGVTINNATIAISGTTQGRMKRGTVLTLLSNTSANPISGAFSNLADGAIVTVDGINLQASYEGGDGNDLTLTVVP